jgi:hypothetical protein
MDHCRIPGTLGHQKDVSQQYPPFRNVHIPPSREDTLRLSLVGPSSGKIVGHHKQWKAGLDGRNANRR